jgi:hypothetical protein
MIHICCLHGYVTEPEQYSVLPLAADHQYPVAQLSSINAVPAGSFSQRHYLLQSRSGRTRPTFASDMQGVTTQAMSISPSFLRV